MRFRSTSRRWGLIPLVAFALPCALTSGSAAANGRGIAGKYCIDNGSTMLLIRPSANGGIEFGMSSWNSRGNYFGVSGTAQPQAGGWRFRQNMKAADPAQRCEVLLGLLPDGGYSFAVTPAGSCEADGGYGAAPQPGYKILFSATSRQGALPPNKPMAEAMSLEQGGVSCNKPR